MTASSREIGASFLQRVVPKGGNRYGVVVGIDVYREKRLELRCAAADARAIFDLMVDAECGLFPASNVKLLLDEEATTNAVWSALADLRKAGPDDTVWIYFAGHGAIEGDEAYWVTHDADVNDLYKTGLDRKRINDVLSKLACKQVLLVLDCCHAAATALQKNATRALPTNEELFGRYEGKGVITLAASDGAQKSVELSELGHGAFTYYLEKGLRGDADEDGDGVVTADELWTFLRKKVEEASSKVNNKQTPVLMGMMTHDIALTLNPVAIEGKKKLADAVERMLGLGRDKLSTDEARFCVELLRRGAGNDAEVAVLDALAKVESGALEVRFFKPIVEKAMREGGLLPSKKDLPATVETGGRRVTTIVAALGAIGVVTLAIIYGIGFVLKNGGVPPLVPSSTTAVAIAPSATAAPTATAGASAAAIAISPPSVDDGAASAESATSSGAGKGSYQNPWDAPPGWKLWRKGETIKIQFMNGDAANQAEVKRLASKWEPHVNLKFQYTPDGGNIRIKFNDVQPSWSFIGTDALYVKAEHPTMSLMTMRGAKEAFAPMVLQQFGHVLGLVSELQNPNAQVQWDKDAVYDHFHYMEREWVDRTIFDRISEKDLPGYREFDPKSIMTYRLPPALTLDKMQLGGDTLSASDKQFIAKLYPKD